MNTPRYAAAAAKLLSKHLPEEPGGTIDRERSVQTIERALRGRARRRTALLTGAVTMSAAALIALAAWPRGTAPDGASVSISVATAGRGAAVQRHGAPEPISSGVELSAGQRLETSQDGGATLRLSTGTNLVLSGRTSFRVDSQGRTEKFSLERGELTAHVAKLSDGSRFLITTPDAEVEVRGTRFRLGVVEAAEACGGGSRTRLEVTEGWVEVRARGGGGERISVGDRWPRDCLPEAARRAEPPAMASVEATPSAHHRNSLPVAAPPSPPAPASTLGQESSLALQNDLFAQGVALRRQGDVSGALRAYGELISRFPSSPLAENAMVDRMRLLAPTADPRAKAEAQRYLARYPSGFAAKEARRLLGDD